MPVQYRTVTGFFTARVPDGADAGTGEDIEHLTGTVRFDPKIANGEVVTYPESKEIVYPPAVECEVVDGRLKIRAYEGAEEVWVDPALHVTAGAGADQRWHYVASFDLSHGDRKVKFSTRTLNVEPGPNPIDLAELIPLSKVPVASLPETLIRSTVAAYIAELGGLPGGGEGEDPKDPDPTPDPEPGPSFDPPTSAIAPAVLPDPVEDGQRFVDSAYFARPSSATDIWAWKPVVTGAPQVTDVTHNGAHTVLLDRPGEDARISENATAVSRGETINATVWVKAPQGETARFRLFITSIGQSGNTRLGYDAPWLTVTDGDWIKVAISATVPGDADGVQVRAAQADAPVYVSDAELWMTQGTPGRSFTLDGMSHRDGETYTIPGEGNPREVVFSPDGGQFSVVERAARRVSVHHLSTPWDITTAQPWESRGFELPSAVEFGHGHAIRPDGKRMWVFNRTEVWQWDLATAWVPATAHNVTRQTLPEITRGHDLDFKTDGARLLIDDRIRGTVDMFTLSTPWDVTTATHTASRVVTRQAAMRGIEMTPDGSTLFQLDQELRELWQYELGTPWDITTMRWVQTRGMTATGTDPRSITWAGDGGSFYVTDATSGVMTRLWATTPTVG